MARILLAWELGANAGHGLRLISLGRRFIERGHHVTCATGRPEHLEDRIDSGIRLLHLPRVSCAPTAREQILTYACMLRCHGYANSTTLQERVSGWREAIRESRPDLVMADHSPTALLASRMEGVPAAAIGVGFSIPPRTYPLPHLQWWKTSPGRAKLRRLERQVHESINAVLRESGVNELNQASDLFDLPLRALTTVPMLDDYPNRSKGEDYYGLHDKSGDGIWPGWPNGDGSRVFGYLRAKYPAFRSIVEALSGMTVRAVIHVPDCPNDLIDQAPPHVSLVREPLNMQRGTDECDFAVSYGSAGFVSEVLAAGKPLLLSPAIVHHAMTAQRVVSAGAALPGGLRWSANQYTEALSRLIEEPALTRNAHKVAEHIAQYPRGAQVEERIVEESEKLL